MIKGGSCNHLKEKVLLGTAVGAAGCSISFSFCPKANLDWPASAFLFFDATMRRIASKLAANKIAEKREEYMTVV
jgi:hypothetical protein